MLELLTDIRQRLVEHQYQNEEQIRLSLVARVLHGLGWNIWDPREVHTEHQALAQEKNYTKTDLTLRIFGHDPQGVLIECKRMKLLLPQLAKVEEQVIGYNKNNLAHLVVLTDGQHWRLYYTPAQVSFSQRLFARYDLLADDLTELANGLTQFLSRARVADGHARQAARQAWLLAWERQQMHDLQPAVATRMNQKPYVSRPQALVELMTKSGFAITLAKAESFLDELHGHLPKSLPTPLVAAGGLAPARQKATPRASTKPVVAPTPPVAASPFFKLTQKGQLATGQPLPTGRWRVLAGSTAVAVVTPSFTKKLLRDTLLTKQVLQLQGSTLVFLQDYDFVSARAAADVIVGSPVNAQLAWVHTQTNQPLKAFALALPAPEAT